MTFALPVVRDTITDAERKARCAWVVFLDDLLSGHVAPELVAETATTLSRLQGPARVAHLAWRKTVDEALEAKLQEFCPGHGDCCDREYWPKEPA